MMNIHPRFQLHGKSFSNPKELLLYVKEKFPSHFLFLKEWFNTEEVITAHTSGSTGKSKPVEIPKKAMIDSARLSIDFFELPPGTKALLNLSSGFIAGKMMWIRALTGGWNLYVSAPENKAIDQILQKEKFDFGAMVPMQLITNLKHIKQFTKLIIGGGALSTKHINKIQDLSTAIFATYGMTETITHVAVQALNTKAEQIKTGLKKEIYTALPSIQFDIDKRGCLIIRAPHVQSAPVVTNDLVELIDEKKFRWKGRYDYIINSGGVKLQPEEIEKKLAPFINVPFFIASLPDEKLGEKLILVLESNKIPSVRFSNILNKYEIPKEIYTIPEFIKTSSGKIKRKETLKKLKG